MASQRQIQAGETFVNEASGQKVTRTGNVIQFFDPSGKQTSQIDVTQPGNEAAGFLSSQFQLQGGGELQPAVSQIEINEQQRFNPGISQEQARTQALDYQGMTQQQRLQNFQQAAAKLPEPTKATLINPTTGEKRVVKSGSPEASELFALGFVLDQGVSGTQLTANREAQAAYSPNVIGDGGKPMALTQTLTADPLDVLRNISLRDDQRAYLEGFATDQPLKPSEFRQIVSNLKIGPEQESAFFRRETGEDGVENIFLREDLFQALDRIADEETFAKAAAPVTLADIETRVGADGPGGFAEPIIGQDLLQSAFNLPTTDSDITALLQRNALLQQEILKQGRPGELEQELQAQVTEVADQARTLLLSAEMGIEEISDQPIAMQFIIGQAKNVEDQARLKLTALQNQESNLLDKLNIAREDRLFAVDQLTQQLTFNNQNLETLFKIQDRQIAQEDRLFNRAMALQTGAKQTLSTILQGFQGMYFDALGPDQQAQLANIAKEAGIPMDLIAAGMDNVAGTMAAQNLVDELKSQIATDADSFKYEMDLRKEFNSRQEVKDYREIDTRYSQMIGAWNRFVEAGGDDAPTQEAIQLLFQKMLDPGSVVREGEFARSAAGQEVLAKAGGYLTQLQQGGFGLTPETLRDMVETAKVMRAGAQNTYNRVQQEYISIGDAMGLNSERIVGFGNFQDSPSSLIDPSTQQPVQLPPLNRSYSDLASLLDDNPQYISLVSYYNSQAPGITDSEILGLISESAGFSSDLNMSVNGSTLAEASKKLGNGSTTLSKLGSGIVTGITGSPAWKWGLDFVLKGGKGATVMSPVTGMVIDVVNAFTNPDNVPLAQAKGKKQNKGFGNQVKIKLFDGAEIWISHLENVANLIPGMPIKQGTPIGTQGNTGLTLGNTGTHLDITMKKPDGSYFQAWEVAGLLGDKRLG